MYSRISGIAAIVLVAFQCGCQTTTGAENESGSNITSHHNGIDLTLSAESTEVLVGETVELTLRLENTRQDPLKVWTKQDTYARIEAYTMCVGDQAYDRAAVFVGNFRPLMEYVLEELSQGEDLVYDYRILQDGPTDRLVFPEPGRYVIKLRYPLNADRSLSIDTGELHLLVRSPEGNDAIVLDRINDPIQWEFLQRGLVRPRDAERCVTTLAETLIEYPDTRYRRTIEWALRQYYPTADLRPEMVQLLRKAFGTNP